MAVTSLPQTVAAFHAFVGLAAVLVCFASHIDHTLALAGAHDVMHTIHKLSVYFGTFIGGVTFTGSIVAFGKLQGLFIIHFSYYTLLNVTRTPQFGTAAAPNAQRLQRSHGTRSRRLRRRLHEH